MMRTRRPLRKGCAGALQRLSPGRKHKGEKRDACETSRTRRHRCVRLCRTGPFAGSGTPIANGMHDYLSMLNERDGGIGGVKLAIEECETGYDTKKGL